MNQIITDRLKQSRRSKKLKQSDVANMLNVKSNTISNWENGKSNPDIDTLILLCEVYEISCTDLLEEAYGKELVRPLTVSGIEKDIIYAYRNADPIEKAMVLRALRIEASHLP